MKKKINDRDYYRHKMEMPFLGISVAVSILIFVILSYLGSKAISGDVEKKLIMGYIGEDIDIGDIIIKIGGYLSIIVMVVAIVYILIVFFITHYTAYARDVHITKNQFPILLKAEKEYAKKLGLKNVPKLFIAKDKETIKVKGATFDSNMLIRIFSEEVTCTAENGFYAAKFSIAKKLAAIYMGYYNPILFLVTFFANWIPILSHASNRIMTYTTDKIAAELVGKKIAMLSIMATEINMYMLPHVNPDDYIENTKEVVKEKTMIFANILCDIPIPSYRIDAIRTGKDGRLF